jgi:hypothetical protein
MSLEITTIRASVPRMIEGEVIGRLNLLGGYTTGIECEGDSRTVVTSTIPKKNIGVFKNWLHTFTSGQGTFTEDHT